MDSLEVNKVFAAVLVAVTVLLFIALGWTCWRRAAR